MDMHNSYYVFCYYHKNSVFGALASMYSKCVRNIWTHFYKNNPFSNIRITHGLFLSYMTQGAYCPKWDEEAWVIQAERWTGKPEEANDTIPLRAGPGCYHFWFSYKAVRVFIMMILLGNWHWSEIILIWCWWRYAEQFKLSLL